MTNVGTVIMDRKTLARRAGQSLVEVLVAAGIGAIMVAAAAAVIAGALTENRNAVPLQVSTSLGAELMNNVRVWSEGDWHNILNLATGSTNLYYLNTSSSPFTAVGASSTGGQLLTIGTSTYVRSFYLNDVYRTGGSIVTSGGTYDPSTKLVTVIFGQSSGPTTTVVAYLTRHSENIYDQTDWSGGPNATSALAYVTSQFASSTNVLYATSSGSFTLALNSGGGGGSGGGFFGSGFSYANTITVTSTTSIASGTLTNFPMLVSSTLAAWASTASGGHVQNICTAPNGGKEPCDLVFATSTGHCGTANLNFETESYSSSTGSLVDWVNVPTMQAGTVIYACYGDSAIATDQSHPSSTWNANYLGVYHLASPTSTLQGNDSTANATAATSTNMQNIGFASANNFIDGDASSSFSAAPSFNEMVIASTSVISNNFANSANNGTSWSMSVWFYMRTYNDYAALLGSTQYDDNAQTLGFNIGTGYPNMLNIMRDGEVNEIDVAAPSTSAWHQVAITYQNSIGNLLMYLDGTNVGTYTAASTSYGTFSKYMYGIGGSNNFGNNSIDGYEDEARFMNVTLSPSWVLTEYNNQSSPSTFYAIQ